MMKDKPHKLCSNLHHWDWVQTAFRISKMYQKIIKILLVPQSQVLKGSKRKEKQTENVLNCKIVLASSEEKDTERTQSRNNWTSSNHTQLRIEHLEVMRCCSCSQRRQFPKHDLADQRSSTLDKCITWSKHEIKIGRCMMRLDWEKKKVQKFMRQKLQH